MNIEQGSLWQNNKTNDVYRVICIATDITDKVSKYVVYRRVRLPIDNKSAFLVIHSENLEIGKCELLPDADVVNWYVEFDHKPSTKEILTSTWARPIEMWDIKFTKVED